MLSLGLMLIVAGCSSTAPSGLVPGTIVLSPASPLIGQAVTLSAVGATDPAGRPLSFTWSFGDGTTGVGQSVIHTYPTAASLGVKLTVDDGRATASATATIAVRALSAPSPGSIVGPAQVAVGAAVSLSAQGAGDPDGRPLTFLWNFGDSTTASGQSVTHTYASTGKFVITLTVDDGKLTASTTTNVSVNSAPVIGGIIGPSTALANVVQSFAPEAASDPQGLPLTFSWSLGDGTTANGQNVLHAYSTVGTFTLVLTISNGTSSSSVSRAVTVTTLDGQWSGVIPIFLGTPSATMSLSQSGTDLSGSYTMPSQAVFSVAGSVDRNTGAVNLTMSSRQFGTITLANAMMSADCNTMVGIAATGFVGNPFIWTWIRQ